MFCAFVSVYRLKVQMMWCSLESVFTGGDIAKQMPMEAKKFAKIDKDWVSERLRTPVYHTPGDNVYTCISHPR